MGKGENMKALSFGEILWDVFGDDKTLGGAPLNVLGHIRRLGGNAQIISAVGSDELGEQTVKAIDTLGIDRAFLRISPYGTGQAIVTLKDGIPSYRFNEPAAWDDISLDEAALDKIRNDHYSVFIYGTLAQRSETSRKTLCTLLDSVDADTFFFDVNLRLDFWSEKSIKRGLERATILKMNDEEVDTIAKLFSAESDELTEKLFALYPDLRVIIVTLGKKGSALYERGSVHHVPSGSVKVLDTVGAGDSLSAAFLYFISSGRKPAEALEKASLLADYVVTKQGAIPEYDDGIKERLGI